VEAHLTDSSASPAYPHEIAEACAFLIGNVDHDGYLRLTPEEAAACVPCSPEVALKALELLRASIPRVGARNLAECRSSRRAPRKTTRPS
jgi:DNA-directed RNA polymerase specialized sigma54-like protein